MNERIQELAKQCNAWYPQGYPSAEGGDAAWQNLVVFDKEDLEKFAALIVAECKQNFYDMWYKQGMDIRGGQIGPFFAEFDNRMGITL